MPNRRVIGLFAPTIAGAILCGLTGSAFAVAPMPSYCDSRIDTLPAPPETNVSGRRILLNKYSSQATISYYASKRENLNIPADLFSPHFITESLFYRFSREEDTGIVNIMTSMERIVGTLRPYEDKMFWLTIGDDVEPELVTCH